jgi:hypothetical protein
MSFRLWRYCTFILCLVFVALAVFGASARAILCDGFPPLIAGVWLLVMTAVTNDAGNDYLPVYGRALRRGSILRKTQKESCLPHSRVSYNRLPRQIQTRMKGGNT